MDESQVVIVAPNLPYAVLKYIRIMNEIESGNLEPWYPNSLMGHIRGRMGEVAAYKYLRSKGLKAYANFDKGDTGADLYLMGHIGTEVKSWGTDWWRWGGRAISKGQMPKVKKKAKAIIWCAVDVDAYQVFVMGWSAISDFENVKPVFKGNLWSYQLEKVRPMSSITLLQ